MQQIRTQGLRLALAAMPGWIWPAIAVVLVWLAIAFHLTSQHQQSIAGARAESANLARAFRESMVRTIQEIDQTLLFVRALHRRDGAALDLRPWVESADTDLRLALQIATANREGLVTLSNLRPVTERISLVDRPHFRHFADQPADALQRDHLFVSTPVLGRVSREWTIQFVRMLKTREGDFDGIIVLSIAPGYLSQFYRSVDVGQRGTVSLLGLDRVTRARAGHATAPIGALSQSPAIDGAAVAPEGSFDWQDPIDDTHRIESFARVPGQPLVVSVGLARDEVLQQFVRTRNLLLGSGAVLTLLLALAAFIMWRGQRDLARARAITQVAIENIGQGIIMVDPDGIIVLLNDRAVTLLDIPPSFGPGSRFDALVAWQRDSGEFGSGTAEPLRQQIYQEARPERTLPELYRRRRPNGIWLEIRTIQLPDGSSVRSFRDVSDWEQAQAALVKARDAAESAVQARAQFLAVMSHEIRTPLNGILGIAELLQNTALDPDQGRFIGIIRHSGQHLLDLLNHILDFSKIDQNGIELEVLPFDPAQLLHGAVDMLAPRAAEQGLPMEVVLAPDLPPLVMGDAHRLRQVLLNLLGNALKFTRHGRITTSVAAEPTPGGWRLRFAVRDTGIGIDPAMVPRLFREFTQIDGSITRRFGGSGLGLAISRRLVEAMGGAIAADSTPGQGSEFRFDITVAEAPAGLAADDSALAAEELVARRAPLVLLAEDNRVNRLVATRMAERLGCRVEAVVDGRAALEAVQAKRYDVVLMDVMMPEMDGLAATRAIRALPGDIAQTPIVGLSANAFRSDEATALEAGMNGFVTKPVTLPVLARALARVLAEDKPPAADQPAAPSEPAPQTPAAAYAPTAALAALAQTLGAETAAIIAGAFVDEAPGLMAELRAIAATDDPAALARHAHALAGSAGTVGLDALATALRTLERTTRGDSPHIDKAQLAEIETLFAAGLAALAPPAAPAKAA